MKRWGCKRTQAILKAVELAANGPKSGVVPEILADNDRPAERALESMRASGMSTAHGVDREKIADFQRKAGMTGYDARKRR